MNRINPADTESASSLSRFERPSAPTSFVRHLASSSPSRVAFVLATIAVVLGVVYSACAMLSSPVTSYWFQLSLLMLCAASCYALFPDKLVRILAAPTAILMLSFLAFHLRLVSDRIFPRLSGVVGILAVLGLNVLSVFSGNPVSLAVQVCCFATALSMPLVGAVMQLSTPYEWSYLAGLLLSTNASLCNLLLNRTLHSVSIGIPGRDFATGGSGGAVKTPSASPRSKS